CLVGLALGTMLITDAFLGLLSVAFFAATNAYGFFREGETRRPLLLAAALTAGVVLAAVALGVFPIGGRAVGLPLPPPAQPGPGLPARRAGPAVPPRGPRGRPPRVPPSGPPLRAPALPPRPGAAGRLYPAGRGRAPDRHPQEPQGRPAAVAGFRRRRPPGRH